MCQQGTLRGGAISEDAIYELLARIENLSKKHNLSEALLESGYYQDLDQSMSTMGSHEIMNFFKANSTPEFYKLISDMVVDNKPVSNSSVIYNTQLLPAEQVTLIAVNNIAFPSYGSSNSSTPCLDAYIVAGDRCDTQLALCLTTSIIIGTVNPVIGVALATLATIDYNKCNSNALRSYRDCVQ